MAFRILVSRPGIKLVPPAVKALSPNHWTAREFPIFLFKFLNLSREEMLHGILVPHPEELVPLQSPSASIIIKSEMSLCFDGESASGVPLPESAQPLTSPVPQGLGRDFTVQFGRGIQVPVTGSFLLASVSLSLSLCREQTF